MFFFFFLQFFTKRLQKPKTFVVQFQGRKPHSKLQYKGRRGLKGPRRPTKPSNSLQFKEAARLFQEPQLLPPYFSSPRPEPLPEDALIVACQPRIASNVSYHLGKQRLRRCPQKLRLPLRSVVFHEKFNEVLRKHWFLHHVSFLISPLASCDCPFLELEHIRSSIKVHKICPVVWQFPDEGYIIHSYWRWKRRNWRRRTKFRGLWRLLQIYLHNNIYWGCPLLLFIRGTLFIKRI